MQLLGVYKSTSDQPGTTSIALPSGGMNTPQYPTHQTPRIVIPTGAQVQVTIREEFSTGSDDANWNAAGAWTVDGVQSEHWSLWVMCAWGIQRVDLAGNATWLMNGHQLATNIDSDIHHGPMCFTAWDAPPAGIYTYRTMCYFACSGEYWREGASIDVVQGYGEIAAAVFA